MSQRDQQEQRKPDKPVPPPPENLDPTRYTGTCKWFNVQNGYGFIILDGTGEDIFVHQSSLQMDGFRSLEEGQRVSFNIGPGTNGESAAYNVSAEFPGEELKGSSIHPAGQGTIRCYKCFKNVKHTAKQCHAETPGKKACYKCNSTDHLLRDCPQNPRRRDSEDDANKPGTSASSADQPGTSGSSANKK